MEVLAQTFPNLPKCFQIYHRETDSLSHSYMQISYVYITILSNDIFSYIIYKNVATSWKHREEVGKKASGQLPTWGLEGQWC